MTIGYLGSYGKASTLKAGFSHHVDLTEPPKRTGSGGMDVFYHSLVLLQYENFLGAAYRIPNKDAHNHHTIPTHTFAYLRSIFEKLCHMFIAQSTATRKLRQPDLTPQQIMVYEFSATC